MNNEQILTKAICKAKGYPYGCIVFPDIFIDKKYYSMIFSHKFAKAFWGETKPCPHCYQHPNINLEQGYCSSCFINAKAVHYNWEFHLQQMVLEKEPLKYLEKFL